MPRYIVYYVMQIMWTIYVRCVYVYLDGFLIDIMGAIDKPDQW